MMPPYIFWDLQHDSPILLDEKGIFWFYSEDTVAIKIDPNTGRHWVALESMTDVTPLNSHEKYELLLPQGIWMNYYDVLDDNLIRRIQKLAGMRQWREVV